MHRNGPLPQVCLGLHIHYFYPPSRTHYLLPIFAHPWFIVICTSYYSYPSLCTPGAVTWVYVPAIFQSSWWAYEPVLGPHTWYDVRPSSGLHQCHIFVHFCDILWQMWQDITLWRTPADYKKRLQKKYTTKICHMRNMWPWKKSTIEENHLKNLAGDTQNINESKINLDS
jgi:hypothetical protein